MGLPPAPGVYAKRRCPECTGANDLLEWRQSIDLGRAGYGDFVPPANFYAHYFRCRVAGASLRIPIAPAISTNRSCSC